MKGLAWVLALSRLWNHNKKKTGAPTWCIILKPYIADREHMRARVHARAHTHTQETTEFSERVCECYMI